MLKFKEYLIDAKHIWGEPYDTWGTLDPKGTQIDGKSHPTATKHSDLSKSKLSKLGFIDKRHVDYYTQDGEVVYRTFSKHGLRTAIANFDKLPKPAVGAWSNKVRHEHFIKDRNTSAHPGDIEFHSECVGRTCDILENMKKLVKQKGV